MTFDFNMILSLVTFLTILTTFNQAATNATQKIGHNLPECKNHDLYHKKCTNKCLKHYTGKYCETPINYCKNDSCYGNGECEPYVGGFTCNCPRTRGGKFCQIVLHSPLSFNIKGPTFLYHPLVFVNFNYIYVFYAQDFGAKSRVTVDFGDGTVVQSTMLETLHYHVLLKYFRKTLNTTSDTVECMTFYHVYSKPNVYTIQVQVHHKNVEVFSSQYETQAVETHNCSLVIDLQNPINTSQPLTYFRSEPIVIFSRVRSNCSKRKLHYQWNLYKLYEFDESRNHKNKLILKVATTKSFLNIPPYTATFGDFLVELVVKMVAPFEIESKVFALIYILRKPIIAHIQGGSTIFTHKKFSLYLNASLSYDPNYSRFARPDLAYTWSCDKTIKYISTIDQVLVVPANTLNTGKYTFKVTVNAKNSTNSSTLSIAEQHVYISENMITQCEIKCIRNCLGGFVNPSHESVFQRACLEMVTETHWELLANGMPTESNKLDRVDDYLIIGKLQKSQKYEVILKIRNDTFAVFRIATTVVDMHIIGSCAVHPKIGFAMITAFNVTCNGTKTHMTRYDLREIGPGKEGGTLISYHISNIMQDVTLGPGLRENNYTITLRISGTNNGVSDWYDCKVIVLPLHYYFPHHNDTKRFFLNIADPLNFLLESGNHIELTQQIITSCATLERMLPEKLDWAAKTTYVLVSYLYEVNLTDIKSIEHVGTALDMILNLNLSPKLETTLYLDILDNLICTLETTNAQEEVSEQFLHGMGVIFANIASNIIDVTKSGTDLHSIKREDLMNSGSISTIINILERFMKLYLNFKLINGPPSVMQGSKLSMTVKKMTLNNLLTENQEFLGIIMTRRNSHLYKEGTVYNLQMFTINQGNDLFPLVKTTVLDEEGELLDIEKFEVILKPPQLKTPIKRNAFLFGQNNNWTDENIHVYRMIVPKGGKLLIIFKGLGNNKFQLAINKNAPPTLYDFSQNVTIEQNVNQSVEHYVLVDEEATFGRTFYYIGILPYQSRLSKLRKRRTSTIEPFQKFLSFLSSCKDNFKQQYFNSSVTVGNTRTTLQNNIMPYSFSAYSARCVNWNALEGGWNQTCTLKIVSSSEIACRCSEQALVSIKLRDVPILNQVHSILHLTLSNVDTLLIQFWIIFSLILFLSLLKWAVKEDITGISRGAVSFLADNIPNSQYCYLVMVTTGNKWNSDSTSDVTIELEGTEATSYPHVLSYYSKPVMTRGGHDWFVITTAKPLGEIYCLHVWINYSGASPTWYCRQIVVQDIQEEQIWIFPVMKWFDPLHSDNCLSYTIYRPTEDVVASCSKRFMSAVKDEFELGMHGWISIFYSQDFHNLTRTQRVSLMYVHLVMMMLFLTLYEFHSEEASVDIKNNEGTYNWNLEDAYKGLVAAVLAFPFQFVLALLCRNVRPRRGWANKNSEKTFKRFKVKPASLERLECISLQNDRKSPPSKHLREKGVTFYTDFYEPEREYRLRSNYSAENLRPKETVVSLRTPTTKLEADPTSTPYSNNQTKVVLESEVVPQKFGILHCLALLVWLILPIIAVLCIYVTLKYEGRTEWMSGWHYITSLFYAILISSIFLEPVKLIVCGTYQFLSKSHDFEIEDRSDFARMLFTQNSASDNIQQIHTLRESSIYEPLPEKQFIKYKRNRETLWMMKAFYSDIILLLLLIRTLILVIQNVLAPLDFMHVQSIKSFSTKSSTYGWTKTMDNVTTQDDLVNFINNTIIENIHFPGNQEYFLNPIADQANYLVGVIRLRQVRKSPRFCPVKISIRWSMRCSNVYDFKHYGEEWSTYESPSQYDKPWSYVQAGEAVINVALDYNETKYPRGYYEALLGRSKMDSVEVLNYLVKNQWLDYLTTVVYIDYVLFNPNMVSVTFVSLMAERTNQGIYRMRPKINNALLPVEESTVPMYLLTILLLVCFMLMLYFKTELDRYKLIVPVQLLAAEWNWVKSTLVCFALVTIFIYCYRVTRADYYFQTIAKASTNYPYFGYIHFWNTAITVIIAIMLFVIIIALSHKVNGMYRSKFTHAVLNNAVRLIFSACSLYLSAFLAVTCMLYVLFSTFSFNFRSFNTAFITMVKLSQLKFTFHHFNNFSYNFPVVFCCYLIASFIFIAILRYVTATLVIHAYNNVKSIGGAHLNPTILMRNSELLFLEDTPNKKALKRVLYMQRMEPKLLNIGYTFVEYYLQLNESSELIKKGVRTRAIDNMALHILQPMICPEDYNKFYRTENAKRITRTIITMHLLATKLEYLDAKTDLLIREARYETLYRSTRRTK